MQPAKICWPVSLFIWGYHLFLVVALPLYFLYYTPSIALIGYMLTLVFIGGISITAGYHRLYAHLTYKTCWPVELVLLFFGSMSTQGSVLRWACDHRRHHAFVDTDQDPYSVTRGFMHAHMFWLFRKTRPIDPKIVADLMKNPLVVFQDKHYVFCMLASNISLFLAVGWLLNDYLGSFLFVWWVRLLISHHTTWCINSLAHMWGSQNFSQEHTAVDNYLISFITYGEGYHNYHHSFSHDYRNGIRWYHYDPGKWLIWTLHKLGLAQDVKRVNNFRIVRHLVAEHKEKLLESLKNFGSTGLEEKVTQVGNHLLEVLTTLQTLYDKYKVIPREEARALKDQIRAAKRTWKSNWKDWKRVIKDVNRVAHIQH
jgi:stearoyl-CoA desaturase (delta-9 desaturase)